MSNWYNRLEKYKNNPQNFFIEENLQIGNIVNIPDGVSFENELLFLANEIPGYFSKKEKLEISNKKVINATYASSIKHEDTLIELFTLGRYFGVQLDHYVDKKNPRRFLQDTILENKKRRNIESILDWPDFLITNLENLLFYIMKNSNHKNFIICSIPNSDGKNRFNSFIRQIPKKSKFQNFEILSAPQLIKTTGHELTMYKSEEEKLSILRKSYSIDESFHSILQNNNFQLLIVDDLFTKGTHIKVAVEKVVEFVNLNPETELLKTLSDGGTTYVVDAMINNRIRRGVDVESILKKHKIEDRYNRDIFKKLIESKINIYSCLFLGSTQRIADNTLSTGKFISLK